MKCKFGNNIQMYSDTETESEIKNKYDRTNSWNRLDDIKINWDNLPTQTNGAIVKLR